MAPTSFNFPSPDKRQKNVWDRLDEIRELARELEAVGLHPGGSSFARGAVACTGCPNSCGQHWIADIDIEGKKIKVDNKLTDAYHFCVGGSVGSHQAFARPIGYRCTAIEVPDAIERLLRAYLDTRLQGENLRQFFAR
jgi:sulfite reductase beta subunit-like hemoprotein